MMYLISFKRLKSICYDVGHNPESGRTICGNFESDEDECSVKNCPHIKKLKRGKPVK